MLCITKMLHALQSVLMRTSCGGRTPAAESPMIRARALHRSRSLQQETGISFVMMFAVALGLAGADAARELPGEVAFIGTPAVVGNIKPEFRRELIAAGKSVSRKGKTNHSAGCSGTACRRISFIPISRKRFPAIDSAFREGSSFPLQSS